MDFQLGKRKEELLINEALDQVFDGKQQVVSHDGVISQARTGRSACGLAAANCARLIFDKEDEGLMGEALVRWVLSRKGVEEIISICDYWKNNFHLDMEDILHAPIFHKSLSLVRPPTYSSQCDWECFMTLLREMKIVSRSTSSAVIITKSPEIVVCVMIHTARGDVFIIFDSHIRPNYPLGGGFILNSTIEDCARYLVDLFENKKRSLETGNPFQWQIDLMAQLCGQIVISKRFSSSSTPKVLAQALLESSMTILCLTGELAGLRRENSFLTVELEKAKGEQSSHEATQVTYISQPKNKDSHKRDTGRIIQSSINSGQSSTSRATNARRQSDVGNTHALQLQAVFAMEEQLCYEAEDKGLSVERQVLLKQQAAQFRCGVCLEEYPEDFVARLPHCRHPFCRECMKGYVRSKLREHRFPITCPTCVVERPTSEPGIIDDETISQLGITEDEYRVFEELQISRYSVLIHCRRCRDSMFVDRQEHQEAKILVCPWPRCQYAWCKTCQRAVDLSGPQHSCDGSLELQDLMGRRGWKFCPGCQTPIQKESGCNHMTCMSAGCNTHFCYRCGGNIIRSAMQREIRAATSAHYRQCHLFEV